MFNATSGLGKDGLTLQVGANAAAAENQIKIEKGSFAEVTLTADVSSSTGATAAITACDTAVSYTHLGLNSLIQSAFGREQRENIIGL